MCREDNDTDIPAISSTVTTILDSPPSCIEFSPLLPALFIVGTYTLEPVEVANEGDQSYSHDEAKRKGSLVLFRWQPDGLFLLQTESMSSAVLDLRFSPAKREIFAVATSTGAVMIYKLHEENTPYVEQQQIVQSFPPSTLVLSLSWYPFRSGILAVSLSTGEIAVLDYLQSQPLIHKYQAHSLEAWTVAWSSSWDEFELGRVNKVLCSGGDDSILCSHNDVSESHILAIQSNETTSDGEHEDCEHTIHRDRKTHSAGVTAILPLTLPFGNAINYVVTGSYDEFVRVLLPLPNGKWKLVAEKRLGGGIWRLKHLTSPIADVGKWKILASCMHAGTRVIEISCSLKNDGPNVRDNEWSIRVLAKFEEHESMNYGSDATIVDGTLNSKDQTHIVVSTSFYDRKLCVWRLPLKLLYDDIS